MRIYGLDFTSAPSKRKPITCATCTFEGEVLKLEQGETFTSFTEFEMFLQRDGPWVAGIDAPFAQPRQLIEDLGWPQPWAAYAAHIGALGKDGFVMAVRAYKSGRPKGDKEHKRQVDVLAGAISPMKFSFVPVGRMFFQLAPRLAQTELNIPLLSPTNDSRTVVEAYPALITRPCSYKHDHPRKQTPEHLGARQTIIQKLESEPFQATHVKTALSKAQKETLADDPKADVLDAFLCAVQAAWAYTQRHRNYGIPAGADPLEGWIADPTLLPRKTAR